MKKILLIVVIFISTFVYAKEVPNNNQGVANALPGDYIFRKNGDKIVLSQIDINYARKQLCLSPQKFKDMSNLYSELSSPEFRDMNDFYNKNRFDTPDLFLRDNRYN